MVTLPPGWTVFQGGGIDEELCDQGTPLSLVADQNLSCILNIHTVNLTWGGGVPPYTVTANGGLITVVDLNHGTLKIDAAIPVIGLQCGQVGATAYTVRGSVRFFDNCCVIAKPWICMTNWYNCYGQWIGWNHLEAAFQPTCTEINFPIPDGVEPLRFQTCVTGCEAPVAEITCDPLPATEAECNAELAELCTYPRLMGTDPGLDITNICNSVTMLDLDLPAWQVTGCYPSLSLSGQNYVNVADLNTFTIIPGDVIVAMLAAHLYLHPEQGTQTISGGSLEGLNALFTGGCYPCALAQNTDIVVTVTDYVNNSIAIEVHID
jgi:hypothetical protein